MVVSVRLNQPLACAICPRIIRQNAAQNAHCAAAACSPASAWRLYARSHAATASSSAADQVRRDREPLEIVRAQLVDRTGREQAVGLAPLPPSEGVPGGRPVGHAPRFARFARANARTPEGRRFSISRDIHCALMTLDELRPPR